ncbi:hypothetical protein CIT31_29235 [Mesorhizobium wenxiniae]|uniref:ABC transmembrane type-1 domain-containing protein n=2 Tax=Mesorhizobium wenxiniae TaxID=2014805 RepID=A0A271K8H2_9HYPH|nr:hypothetical protein CIT31_29235 [Mesorhizobium wenxiniae]
MRGIFPRIIARNSNRLRPNVMRQLFFAALILPATLFIGYFFVVPVFLFLSQGFMKDDLSSALKETHAALGRDGTEGLASEAAYAALFADIKASTRIELGRIAGELSNTNPEMRRILLVTSKSISSEKGNVLSHKDWFAAQSELWLAPETWAAIDASRARLTLRYLKSTAPWPTTDISESVPGGRVHFFTIFLRTIVTGSMVSILCLAFGLPVAYLLHVTSKRMSANIFFLVLVCFWTPILARTLIWIVVFQREGVLNGLSETFLGEGGEGLLGTRVAVIVGMTHILLPYMILPLYDGMRKIPPEQLRAGLSMGATPLRALLLVYVPQLSTSISAGLLIVFTLTAGFYLTPLLLGGSGDQMVSFYTAFYGQRIGDWHSAAALSIWLMIVMITAGLTASACISLIRSVARARHVTI